jgi:2-keto-4-pentenoate hydratase/2-oxohepta-3-ene-1,7-dioic acid hydratase in catechol pathway
MDADWVDTMDESRREFMQLGALAAFGTLAIDPARAGNGQSALPNNPDSRLRLASFRPVGSALTRLGLVRPDGQIIDLGESAKKNGHKWNFDPTSMMALIHSGPTGLNQIRAFAKEAAGLTGPDVRQVTLLPPIPQINRNIYAVGWNYLEHFNEGTAARDDGQGKSYPENPVFFSKATHSLNGPVDPIPFDPNVSDRIDWEAELAVIIGKRGRNIPEADAMDYVFGYSVINDTTARDIQQKKHGGQWFKGKSLDGHGPMGPWIVPRDDVDVDNLHVLCRVNGVVKQDASTAQMYFKVPRIISELSLGLTLEPGDIIATGTPPGVGYARTPPEFLKPGDVMETEIAEIGMIRNVIQAV